MNPKIYTTKELANLLGTSDMTIKREFDRGKLRGFKVGNELRFTQYHVDEYTQIKNLGKTQRELELEKEKEDLLEVIRSKDQVIENIKNLILRSV